MKKVILLTILLSLNFNATFSQKKEKIKGNKEIISKQYELGTFKSIEIYSDFEIILTVNNNKNSYELETDSNIHDKINFKIENEILKIDSYFNLSPSKKIKIKLNITGINSLKLFNKSKITQEGFATFYDDFSIEMHDDSVFKNGF